MLCQHCQKSKVNRPRGLCWSCYYRPGVRDLYPSTSKFARRGIPDRYNTIPPTRPTDAEPGSPEKIAVLAERAFMHTDLHHPLDPDIKTTEPLDFSTPHHCHLKLIIPIFQEYT